jgi:hypothetical protein
VECVYGHIRGLAEAKFPRTGLPHEEAYADKFLAALGIASPPSARTLLKIVACWKSGAPAAGS